MAWLAGHKLRRVVFEVLVQTGRADSPRDAWELHRALGVGFRSFVCCGHSNSLVAIAPTSLERNEVVPLFEETIRLQKAELGPDHPDTLVSMGYLAMGYQVAGRLAKALPLFNEAATGIELRRFQHEHVKHII